MKIIETNQFKHLCHLCLFISMGTDAEIKKHLAVELKLLKVQIFTVFKNTTNLCTLVCTMPSFAISKHVLKLFSVLMHVIKFCHRNNIYAPHGQGK